MAKPCPKIEAVLDAAFRSVVGSPCVPVPPEDPADKRARLAERRETIVRLYRAGWKRAAIAAETGASGWAVGSTLRRARERGEIE